MTIKKCWHGFVPPYIAHPTKLCAYYHCPKGRWEDRRYCLMHSAQYDQEAKREPETNKIVKFDGSYE